MIDSTILKCITSMPVEDLKKCTESCWMMGGGEGWREGVKESNKGSRINQSKAYSQLGYTKKPLWTLTLELKDKTVNRYVVKGLLLGGGGWKEEVKVREYDWWASYTYMK
jgi:hypothetical protein